MNLKDYQEFAALGILPATLEREPIIGFALGLAGETGEVVDDIKKKYFHGRNIDVQHTLEELGDVMWYVANVANQMGASLEEILDANAEKLRKRYPDMYGQPTEGGKERVFGFWPCSGLREPGSHSTCEQGCNNCVRVIEDSGWAREE